MKQFLLFISLFFSLGLFGQQDAIYSQYMFNPFAVNPAYAGSRDAASIVLINRSQWLGLQGAPNTQTLAAHLPTNRYNLAWGLNVTYDQVGPSSSLLAAGTAAYQLVLERGTLNFGLRGGVYNTVLNGQKLNFREENDALDHQMRTSAISPTFDFGMYYYTDRFYAGLAVNHLTRHRLNFDQISNNEDYFLKRHIFLMSGYAFETRNNIIIKPSVLLKHAEGQPFNADVNLNALFKEKFWVGIGLRNFSSLNFLVDLNVTDYLRIGYSYDITLTKLKTYSYGSHEILLGFDFNLKKAEVISPRYL